MYCLTCLSHPSLGQDQRTFHTLSLPVPNRFAGDLHRRHQRHQHHQHHQHHRRHHRHHHVTVKWLWCNSWKSEQFYATQFKWISGLEEIAIFFTNGQLFQVISSYFKFSKAKYPKYNAIMPILQAQSSASCFCARLKSALTFVQSHWIYAQIGGGGEGGYGAGLLHC